MKSKSSTKTKINKKIPNSKRPYDNRFRRTQTERTRELITRALLAEVRDNGFRGFSLPQLSKRAGISPRTIWRYFPNRDALAKALAESVLNLDKSTSPLTTPDDFAKQVEEHFPKFDRDAAVHLATLHWREDFGIGLAERTRREKIFLDGLRRSAPYLTSREREELKAIIFYLCNKLAWKTLREEFELDGRISGKLIGWAIRTLLKEVHASKGLKL